MIWTRRATPSFPTSTNKPRKREVRNRMSIIEPRITDLLNETDNDRFLLCALASKPRHDINDMMRGQRDRAIQLQTAVEIAKAADKKPLSMAFAEIARGDVRPTTPKPSTRRTTSPHLVIIAAGFPPSSPLAPCSAWSARAVKAHGELPVQRQRVRGLLL